MTVERAAVIGVGLIGGSVALALKKRGLAGRVAGAGRSAGSLNRAIARGAIDEAASSPEDAVRGAGVVVLAAPVGSIPPLLGRIARHVAPRALVTDAGSAKSTIVAAADRAFGPGGVHPSGAVFVGAHPLAGSERTGVAAARETLFEGATVVVTPGRETPFEAVERATAFWESLGAIPQILEAGEHDRVLAATSHLPQAVASALMSAVTRLVSPTQVTLFSGTGLCDTARLAASGAEMWTDILLANRGHVLAALGAVQNELRALAEALERDDEAAVRSWLENARAAHAALPA